MIYDNIHDSWKSFLTDEIKMFLTDVEKQLIDNYTPEYTNILRFMNCDCRNIKVVIIGQDPYYQPGVANGRSFQVANLYDWNQKFAQVSLKNIVRLIYKSIKGTQKTYKEILCEINSGDFLINNPTDWFDSLEKQGVLFINRTLTCQINKPNSHKKLWAGFLEKIVEYLNVLDVKWFLWGKEANTLQNLIKGEKYCSNHPMICGVDNPLDFLNNTCFYETKNIIDWLGNK